MSLKLKPLWLLMGYGLVAFVIYSTLDTDPIQLDVYVSDKLMHMSAYFGMMGWFLQIYHEKKMQIILAIVFVSMGVALEYLQDMGGVRFFEVNDMAANAAGVMLAWSLVKTPFPKTLFYIETKLLSLK